MRASGCGLAVVFCGGVSDGLAGNNNNDATWQTFQKVFFFSGASYRAAWVMEKKLSSKYARHVSRNRRERHDDEDE